jgi:transposase
MEACATAHDWARTLRAQGMDVRLLPAKYVRAYVKRNKTDAADALALLEAARGADITPVAVKSIEQQALQALHRLRSGWMGTRTRRINTLRGFCREFGMEVSVGAARGLAQIARLLADEHSAIPAMLRPPMRLALEEIRLMEARIDALERELAAKARQSDACQALAAFRASGFSRALPWLPP